MRVAAFLLLLASCYRPGLEGECRVACSANRECPSGATCGTDLYCHAPGEIRDCLVDARMTDGPSTDGPRDSSVDAPDIGPVCPFVGRYKRFANLATWQGSEIMCESLALPGSTKYVHLATIRDQNEFNNLVNAVGNTGNPSWIGHSDLETAGNFVFVTDEPFITQDIPWGANQPSSVGIQHCVYAGDITAGLFNVDCAMQLPSICECDDEPVNPQHFP